MAVMSKSLEHIRQAATTEPYYLPHKILYVLVQCQINFFWFSLFNLFLKFQVFFFPSFLPLFLLLSFGF